MGSGNLAQILEQISAVLWSPVTLGYFVICGIFLTVRFRFVQIRKFRESFVVSFTPSKKPLASGAVTKFRALMTALGGSVGTGNIVGVSTAISYGGPGALFWMWISAVLGMAVKYTEGVLGSIYRQEIVDEHGRKITTGGPMYYIKDGFAKKFGTKSAILSGIAVVYCFMMVCESLVGPCMVQSNAIAANFHHITGISKVNIGLVLTFLTLIVILGGGTRIMQVSEYLVPVMGFVYLGGCSYVIFFYIGDFLPMIKNIFVQAFSSRAASSGVVGYGMGQAMRYGFARGLYSNEAGTGVSAITAATADGDHPVEQGFLSIVSTCVDTIFVCTMTGFAVLVSGAWNAGPAEANLFVQKAFSATMGEGLGMFLVSSSLFLFAYTSAIAWCFFGERFALYICGPKILLPYRLLYGFCMFLGALLYIDVVWYLADILVGIIFIPSIFILVLLSGEVAEATDDYDNRKVR